MEASFADIYVTVSVTAEKLTATARCDFLFTKSIVFLWPTLLYDYNYYRRKPGNMGQGGGWFTPCFRANKRFQTLLRGPIYPI